ncbi:MAG: DUF4838 domain-containing protein, partial [Lentisphaeria bacterium]|nr:DUF4838 domain-containing protein [Lentisphaeria bacterium]
MKRKTFLSVLLLLLCSTMLRGADQDFALVLNGKGVCRFEIRKNSPADLYRAVNRFNGALKKITGVGLSYSSHIPKGRKITFSVQKLTDLRSADHYEITFPDKDTMLVKGTLASIQWALNDLIRSTTHAEWILPENCGLSYTEMKEVTLPRKKIVSKKYSWNLTRILGQRTSHWHLHARQGIRVDHDLTRHAFPSSKYGKNNTWPEAIMPVLNGKKITALPDPKNPRCYWQPCYSNPETAQIAIRNLLEYLKAHPDLPGLSLAVNDNACYCECKKCMTLDKKKRYERSESYYTFVNAVVKAVASKYPEKFFSVLAYGATYLPPSFPLHPNVGVMLTIDIGSCVNPVMLKKHKEVIRAWSRKASVLGIWDYSWGYPYPMCRSYEPYHTDLLRFLYEHNGRFYCGESWTYDAHEGPKHYVIGRLLRDHSIDVKKVRQ